MGLLLSETSIFNFSNIIAFLLGILAGFILFLSFLGIYIARGKKKIKKIEGPKIDDLSKDVIREMIEGKKEAFIKEVEENEKDYFKSVALLSLELIHEISTYYYPNSEYPEYELTITEAADLIKYIVDQITLLFDKPILSRYKNMRLAKIASLIDKSRKLKKNKLVGAAKDTNEAFKAFKAIKNIANPIYFVKAVVVKGIINVAIKKVCKAGIEIIGNESDKVYSKHLFNVKETNTYNEHIEEIFSDEEE